jgi:hypothetical protein
MVASGMLGGDPIVGKEEVLLDWVLARGVEYSVARIVASVVGSL